MKKIFSIAILLTILLPGAALAQKSKKKKGKDKPALVLESKLDSLSYAIGVNLANSLSADGIDSVNARAVIAG